MGLFGRHSRRDPSPSGPPPGQAAQPGSRLAVAGLAEHAAARGWQAGGEVPLDSTTRDIVHDAARTMFGAPRSMTPHGIRVTETRYRDCYTGAADGHEFLVANAWTSIVDLHAVSVCQVRLGWFLGEPVWVEPARYVPIVAARRLETGDPAFDRQLRVHAAQARTVAELLAADVRALLLARDDWFFAFGGAVLLCVCREGYRSPEDVERRLAEVAGIADALPPPSAQHAAAQPIMLSGGAVFDPAHIEEWKAALAAVPPARQQQMLAELRARLAERRAQRPARKPR